METKPKCVIITGRPGAGKTTFAHRLSRSLHMPLLSRDELKEGYVSTFGVSHDKLPEETNWIVTDLFFRTVHLLLEAKVSVIVEAAFQHKLWEEAVPRWSAVGLLYFVICEADPVLCTSRHVKRGLNDPAREFYHGDQRVGLFKKTGKIPEPETYDPPVFDIPTLKVSTTAEYNPDLPKITEFIMQVIA